MIGQDSAEGSFNLISTSKELLHPDLLWNKAQSMIVSLKRIFDTMCMYPTKTKLSGQRQDANLTALTCNGVRWWWRLIGVEMMDPFFCSQSLMLSLVTSVHIYNISKCKDYAAKDLPPIPLFRQWQGSIDTFNTHWYFGLQSPCLGKSLGPRGTYFLIHPPFR